MELPVLTAGIDVERKNGQELLVEVSTDKNAVEQMRVGAGSKRSKAQVDKRAGKLGRVFLP